VAEPEFQLLDPLPGTRVRLRFSGLFQGRPVVWEATLLAAAEWVTPQTPGGRRFIEVGPESAPGRRPVTVGLHLAEIDRPTVIKSLLMVRQYRLLREGRKEFG